MNIASRLPYTHTAIRARHHAYSHKLVGVILVAILPALFWVAFTAAAAAIFGLSITPPALALLGGAISLFLASICGPIMLRN